MKTLVTLLHMSLLDINNSNVSAILSVSSWSVSHISIFFFSPVSGVPPDGESPQKVLGEQSILLSVT